MHFDRSNLGELAKCFWRKRACAVLDSPTHSVAASVSRHLSQGVEVDGHLGNGPVGQHHTAVRRARVNADLRQRPLFANSGAKFRLKTLDKRFQLVDGAVLLAHLADLTANRDRYSVGFELADERS